MSAIKLDKAAAFVRPNHQAEPAASPRASSSESGAVVLADGFSRSAQATRTPAARKAAPGATAAHHPSAMATRLAARGPSLPKAFSEVVGPQAIADLKALFNDKPVVLIAGDQLTGKSTVAGMVAKQLGDGKAASTGKIVRAMAAERGISIEEMSKRLAEEPGVDQRIDYEACKLIATGGAMAVESRLAGHLADFLRGLGRKNLFAVYLACSPRERALRYVYREVSPQARQRLDPLLDVEGSVDLAACLSALAKIDDPAAAKVTGSMGAVAARDAQDYERLQSLYGIDYRDRSVFDLVVDTSNKSPDEVLAAVLAALPAEFAQGEDV